MCKTLSALWPWIKSIAMLFLILLAYYELFPSRKCIQIEIWTDGTSSNITGYILKLPICCILASGPFALQPYYSRGKNMKFYSTSHVNTFLSITNDRRDDCHSEKTSRIQKKHFFQFLSFFTDLSFFFQKCAKLCSHFDLE